MDIKVINMDDRPERMKQTAEELYKVGIYEYERVSAVVHDIGHIGCMYSHVKAMEGEGAVLIFEDDAIFEPGAQEMIENCINQLPDDFDLFYLGANVKEPAERYSDNLFRVFSGVHCTHAMFYSPKGRMKFNQCVDDILRCGLIDHWFYTEGLKILDAYVASPLIAFQRPGYSDIRRQWFDYRGEMIDNANVNMV